MIKMTQQIFGENINLKSFINFKKCVFDKNRHIFVTKYSYELCHTAFESLFCGFFGPLYTILIKYLIL